MWPRLASDLWQSPCFSLHRAGIRGLYHHLSTPSKEVPVLLEPAEPSPGANSKKDSQGQEALSHSPYLLHTVWDLWGTWQGPRALH